MFNLTTIEIDAFYLTLKVAFFSVAICLPLGVITAFTLSRLNFPGKWLLDGLVHLPLVMPPVVVGYMLLLLLGRRGVLGSWLYDTFDITVAFTWKGQRLLRPLWRFHLWFAPLDYHWTRWIVG